MNTATILEDLNKKVLDNEKLYVWTVENKKGAGYGNFKTEQEARAEIEKRKDYLGDNFFPVKNNGGHCGFCGTLEILEILEEIGMCRSCEHSREDAEYPEPQED